MSIDQFVRSHTPLARGFACAAAILMCAVGTQAMDQTAADALALSLLTQSGRHCAAVAVPKCGSGELAVGFWNKGDDPKMLVDAFESDPILLKTAQGKASALGLLGRNIYVRSGTLSTTAYSMPYADNFMDLVAVTGLTDSDLASVSYNEIERILAPGAKAWVGRATAEGGSLSSAALTTWIAGTHDLSAAAVVSDTNGTWAVITKISRLPDTYEGNMINSGGSRFHNDKRATWPTLPQWLAKPKGITIHAFLGGTHCITSGGGRVYRWLPDIVGGIETDHVYASSAYNGQLLWELAANKSSRSTWIFQVYSRTGAPYLAAFSKGVIYDDQIIDGETGESTAIPFPDGNGYAYAKVDNDILYAALGDNVGKNTLFAYDLANRAIVYSKSDFIDNNALLGTAEAGSLVVGGGKLYVASQTSLYCYNAATGDKIWGPVTIVTAPAMIIGINASTYGVLVSMKASNSYDPPYPLASLAYLSVADGSVLWTKSLGGSSSWVGPDIVQSPYRNGGKEFVCWENYSTTYDILTGVATTNGSSVSYNQGNCTRDSVTPQGTWNGRAGGYQYSFEKIAAAGQSSPNSVDCDSVPFATDGMMMFEPRNCPCFEMHFGTKAEVPQGSFNPDQTAVESERLEKGPVYSSWTKRVVPDELDWPTHRANNSRSASSHARVATSQCVQLWKYDNPNKLYTPPAAADYNSIYHDVTPPVTAGGYTYLAGSDGVVKCLDNADGSLKWSYATGGWVFATPTVWNGCVYVGSGDGYAYCFEAHTGELVWRFRAAPAERRFNYYGHLISSWPILTGVLVNDGVAYFVSGMLDEWGVQAYAVDAATGAIIWQKTSAGVCLANTPGVIPIS